MKKLVQLLFLMTAPFVVMASELKEGTLSVLLFSEGKPLSANEVKIDGKKVFRTDKDGTVKIPLSAGRHQVEIFGKNVASENLGYFKKPVLIKEGRDTEVIATLSKSGADSIDIDTPVAVAASVEREAEKVTGEGRLSGQVLSSEGNMPIAGARVFVRGTAVDIRTDESGRFSAKVPSGKALSISVVHSAYSAQTIGGIIVKKDATSSRTVKLTPASMELEEFVVLAPKIEGSIADVIAEEKNINAIANILGSEEFSKKGDSNAASALKRVTGVTLVDGKNIYVRGLGERYSNIEMNSMPLPSPDPTKRTVPLDIFPSDTIGSLKVQKSATADIPSNFGGGYIDIRTKDVTKESYISASLGVKGNSNTGSDSYNYRGGQTDWLAYDDGYRAIVSSILNAGEVRVGEKIPSITTEYYTPDEIIAFTKDYVDRDYNLEKRDLPVGFSGSIEAADYYEIDGDQTLYASGSYSYSQTHTFVEEKWRNLTLESGVDQFGTNNLSYSTYEHGGSFNLGYNFLDILKLKYTKLYTRTALQSTRIADGIMGSNNAHLIKYYLDWEERELNADQINAEINYELFNKKSTFEFGAEHATASLYQPNNFYYAYEELDGVTFLDPFSANSIGTRLQSDDELYAAYAKNKFYTNIFSDEDHIDVGLNISTKDRVSRQNKFYLRPYQQNITDATDITGDIESIYYEYVRNDIPYDKMPYRVSPLFTAADYFDATVDDAEYYVNLFTKPYNNVEIIAGIRYVDFTQTIYQYKEDRENPDISLRNLIQKVPDTLAVNDFYPSITAKYKYDENNHVDFALSKTYITPDLREFTDGVYVHPYEVADIVGNPDLTNTQIYNFDLKYSHYYSDTENIKAGIFAKYLDKPIEDVQLPSSSLPIYSFVNSDSAVLYGIEIDGRKNLEFVYNKLTNYYLSGNFTYTDSEVTLQEEQIGVLSSESRQLQGLSPIIVNLSIGYEVSDRIVNLSYNMMGERIRKVGVIDGVFVYPDTFETPPSLVDLVWIEKYKDYTMKFKLGNILNDQILWSQGDLITKEFATGQTVDFSVSKKF